MYKNVYAEQWVPNIIKHNIFLFFSVCCSKKHKIYIFTFMVGCLTYILFAFFCYSYELLTVNSTKQSKSLGDLLEMVSWRTKVFKLVIILDGWTIIYWSIKQYFTQILKFFVLWNLMMINFYSFANDISFSKKEKAKSFCLNSGNCEKFV